MVSTVHKEHETKLIVPSDHEPQPKPIVLSRPKITSKYLEINHATREVSPFNHEIYNDHIQNIALTITTWNNTDQGYYLMYESQSKKVEQFILEEEDVIVTNSETPKFVAMKLVSFLMCLMLLDNKLTKVPFQYIGTNKRVTLLMGPNDEISYIKDDKVHEPKHIFPFKDGWKYEKGRKHSTHKTYITVKSITLQGYPDFVFLPYHVREVLTDTHNIVMSPIKIR
jgi:hypothetical protein